MLTTKLVDMQEMFTHICGKDHIYQSCSHCFVYFRFKFGENVNPCVTMGQFEAQCTMMVLKNSGVIVEDGELTARVTQVGTIASRVIHIMDDGT